MSKNECQQIGSFINGKMINRNDSQKIKVQNPYNNEVIGEVDVATSQDLEYAIENAHETFHSVLKKLSAYERAGILRKAADLLEEQLGSFATLLSLESGKPIRDAKEEVRRAIQVLRFASEEAKTHDGELLKLDASPNGADKMGFAKRYPIGVVAAITPFNFPLNLVLHKVAPAIAVGCTVVLKPAEKTPFSAVKLALLLQKAGLPDGALNVVMGTGQALGKPLVTHPYVKKVTFTGSEKVGYEIKKWAFDKKVTLELGSNSPNIVFQDANIENAVSSIIKGSFAFSGQTCISVQRLFVHEEVFENVLSRLVEELSKLKMGDPLDESTDIGPLINIDQAKRIEKWINEAVENGAKLLIGGNRKENIFEPTIMTGVKPDMKVVRKEIFGPVIVAIPFKTIEEVVALANDSDYGLQAGIFTENINLAFRIAEDLDIGGVWINECSTVRQDNYPYGGVKRSGVGKEGVRYAMEDMTETKFIGIKLLNWS